MHRDRYYAVRYRYEHALAIHEDAYGADDERVARELAAAVADARIIPLSKMFRQVRRAQDPALFEEMGIEDDSYTVEPHTPLPGDGDTADSPLRSPTPAKPDEGRQKSGIAMLKKIGGGTKALFQDDQPSSFTGDGDLNMKDAKEALKLNR